jgi:hypothetical protein
MICISILYTNKLIEEAGMDVSLMYVYVCMCMIGDVLEGMIDHFNLT